MADVEPQASESFDGNLIDDDAALDGEDFPPERTQVPVGGTKPKKKRGKGKAANRGSIAQVKKRQFSEDQLRQTLGKTDLGETMARWDWESGSYTATVTRIQPQSFRGKNIQGYLSTFSESLTEDMIKGNFGGGTFDIKVRGPAPGGGHSCYLDGVRVKIAGDPRISESDPHYLDFARDGSAMMPEGFAPSSRDMSPRDRKRLTRGMAEQVPSLPPLPTPSSSQRSDEDTAMLRMSLETLQKHIRDQSAEAQRLRDRLTDDNSKDGAITQDALRLIKEAGENASQAQQESFNRIFEMSSKSGVPPEMLQSLTETHRAELRAMQESFEAKLTTERERGERDVTRLRDQADRDLASLREQHAREIERLREDSRRDIAQAREQSKGERESNQRQNELQIESLKATHALAIENLKNANESTKTILQATSDARIQGLEAELARLRTDLDSSKSLVAAQGDLAAQATKLKDVKESLGAVFAPDIPTMPVVAGSDEEETPKGIFGSLVKLANTEAGAQIVRTVLENMGGGGAPGQAPYLPSPYPPQPAYPQPGYPPQPPMYPQPSYPPGYEDVEGVEVPLEEDEVVEAPASSVENAPEIAAGTAPESSGDEPSPPAGQDFSNVQVPEHLAGMSPHMFVQVQMLVTAIEDGMKAGTSADEMASKVDAMSGGNQAELAMLVSMPPEGLAKQCCMIIPETQLGTFGGKKYIKELHAAIIRRIQAPPSAV